MTDSDLRQLADRLQTDGACGSAHWTIAQILRVWMSRHRHDLDEAIAQLRLLLPHADASLLADLTADLADLLLHKYNASPADDCTHLVEAIDLLWTLTNDELDDEQRGLVESLLGLALVERFRWQRRHGFATPGQLYQAQAVLERCLRHLAPDDPQRLEVVLELARLHSFRSTEPGFTGDVRADRDAAIRLFRSVCDRDERAALDLAEVLAWRYGETADRADRDEAIALLRGLGSPPPVMLGGLLLDRARENPFELDEVVAFLESSPDRLARSLLIEAYCLRERPADTAAVLDLVDALLVDPDAVADRHIRRALALVPPGDRRRSALAALLVARCP